MPMLRTIERPTNATLRPCFSAASRTCWMRCTWLAKLATMMRRCAVANTRSIAGPMSRSGVVKPGTSALVESTRNRSTPSSPSRANARRSVMRPSSGSWSILKSPVCRTRPAGVRIATASASGIEWLTARNSQSNGPSCSRPPSRHLEGVGLDPVLLQLGLDQRQGEPRAEQRDVRLLAQQVGHGADVVLVAVGEHDGVDAGRGGPGCSRSRGGSGRRRAGSPRGTARRSRRRAAARRTRRRSCCGRSRRDRRGRRPAGRPPGAPAARRARGGGGSQRRCRRPRRARAQLGHLVVRRVDQRQPRGACSGSHPARRRTPWS